MDRPAHGKPLPAPPAPPIWQESSLHPFAPSKRPLSDIKELTEPSLFEPGSRNPLGDPQHGRRVSRSEIDSFRMEQSIYAIRPTYRQDQQSPTSSPSRNRGQQNRCRLDPPMIPDRSTSRTAPTSPTRLDGAMHETRPSSRYRYHSIPNEGHSNSPVRNVVDRLEQLNSKRTERLPSKTILKIDESAYRLLDNPIFKHPRINIDIRVSAPLFVGGSSVEGKIHVVVDEAERTRHRKSLTISILSVDLLGVEELSTNRRSIFLALGNELIDIDHPPPYDMIDSLQPVPGPEQAWVLVPSSTSLPFLISLPLHVGPPPFRSKHANIRYVIFATIHIRDAGKEWVVRRSQDTAILSVHDPEKALMSLPSPLTASDKCLLSRGSTADYVRATAGLHRQTWVSGTSIFVDVHIANSSHKTVKKLELELQRDILCYEHTPAATLEMSASQARLYDRNERTILSRKTIRPGTHGWKGVPPLSTDLRTCELELPRNESSVACNKYFEVRYYLNVVAGTSRTRLIKLQLPVHLIHMNSLDVPTNSVAQVAAAIERRARNKKATSEHSPHLGRKKSSQGRAFAAPRMQSLERVRDHERNLEEIGRILEASPRKTSFQSDRVMSQSFEYKTPPSNRKGRVILENDVDQIRQRLRHVQSTVSNATRGPSLDLGDGARPSTSMNVHGCDGNNDREQRSRSRAATVISRAESRFSFDLKKPRWPGERWRATPWWESRKSGRSTDD